MTSDSLPRFLRTWGFVMLVVAGLVVLAVRFVPTPFQPEVEPAVVTTTEPTTTTTTEYVPPPPPRGGEVTVGMVGEPESLNPFLSAGANTTLALVGGATWAGAVELDGVSLDPVPVLLEELPTVANGGLTLNDDGTLTVLYRIRAEAAWEDGSPVTGADFEFTYLLLTDGSLPIRTALRDQYGLIIADSVEADEKTFTFTLRQPTIDYLSLFSIVVPRSQVGESDFAEDWNDRMWMAAGPFRFAEWVRGQSIRFVRNPNYWETDPPSGAQLPNLDGITFAVTFDEEELVERFRAGEIDVAALPGDPALVAELEDVAGVDVQVRHGPEWEHLNFHYGPGRLERNPLSLNEHLDFRRAVAFLVDRAAIAEQLAGVQGMQLDSIVGMSWPGAASDAWSAYTRDVAVAAGLLEDLQEELGDAQTAGPPQVVFSSTNSLERQTVAGLLLGMFAEAGIELDVQLEDTGFFFRDTVNPGLWDLGEWAWLAESGPVGAVHDLQSWFVDLPADEGFNFYSWGTADSSVQGEEVDRLRGLLMGLDEVVDLEELKRRLAEVETLLAEQVVVLPLYPILNPGAAWTERVMGYQHSTAPGGDLWNVEEWFQPRALALGPGSAAAVYSGSD